MNAPWCWKLKKFLHVRGGQYNYTTVWWISFPHWQFVPESPAAATAVQGGAEFLKGLRLWHMNAHTIFLIPTDSYLADGSSCIDSFFSELRLWHMSAHTTDFLFSTLPRCQLKSKLFYFFFHSTYQLFRRLFIHPGTAWLRNADTQWFNEDPDLTLSILLMIKILKNV